MKMDARSATWIAALLGVSCILGVSEGAASAKSDDSKARAEIAGLYHTADVGLSHKNTKPLIAVLAPDFTFVQGKTTFDRTKAIQALNQEFNSPVNVTPSPTVITSFKIENGKAIVATKSSTSISQVDAQGKKHTIVENGATIDTWVKTKTGWNLKTSVFTSEAVTIDGKALTGSPRN